jgi:two-component system sensor histidine kinase BaeS
MPLPRLRIAHQLSLLMTGAVLLAVLGVGALSLWSLRSGFHDYLQQRDEEQLTRLVKLVERRAAADPSMNWLRNDREAMRELMDELSGRGVRRRGPPPPPPPPGFGYGFPPPPGRERPPPPELAMAGNLPDRVVILDAQGERLGGHGRPPGLPRIVRAALVDGVTVATLELSPELAPEGGDALFLERQTKGLVGAAFFMALLSVLAAWWVAGRWSRPLRALQLATHRIASGQRSELLVPEGAQEIAQLMEDVNTMTQSLSRLENARRLWIAQISHELRTPLSVLRGEIESIEDGARKPTPEVMAGLRDEVLQLTRLVNDLHTLSVADVEGLHCTFTQGDAHGLLLRVTQRFQVQASQRGLNLILSAPENERISVCWDFVRVEQLLANLLTNSLRYTDSPGVVRVQWLFSHDALTLTVEDSVPGVPDADLSQLFEPLFRVDRVRQRGGEHGSGLGLSIARTIVLAHGGRITANHSPLGGLIIAVQLPLNAKGKTL